MMSSTETNNFLKIRGAKEHNLQNIEIDIPKNKLIVMTGVSGSGKSSLAFDTIYAVSYTHLTLPTKRIV